MKLPYSNTLNYYLSLALPIIVLRLVVIQNKCRNIYFIYNVCNIFEDDLKMLFNMLNSFNSLMNIIIV